MPQLAAASFVIGDGLGDQFPKIARVIHLLQMAQLVDDDVVDEVVWKLGEPRVKVEVALF